MEETLSIHSMTSARHEFFYWLSLTTTFARGTPAGDFSAIALNLGYFSLGLLFTGLIVLSGLAFRYLGFDAAGAFWNSYVLTRSLGASRAARRGVSHARGGLNLGPRNVALILTIFITHGVSGLRHHESMVQ